MRNVDVLGVTQAFVVVKVYGAANQAALNAVKQREKMVQYPRAQQETTPVGTGGVLSSKP